MVVDTVLAFHSLMRQGVYDLLDEYKTSSGIKLSIYPGWPIPIMPPQAFCESQNEEPLITTQGTRQRNLHSTWVVAWGRFDSADSVKQRDAFVDGFSAYVLGNFHKIGGATDLYVGAVTDIPVYQPEWQEGQLVYYATRITVEGFASG